MLARPPARLASWYVPTARGGHQITVYTAGIRAPDIDPAAFPNAFKGSGVYDWMPRFCVASACALAVRRLRTSVVGGGVPVEAEIRLCVPDAFPAAARMSVEHGRMPR